MLTKVFVTLFFVCALLLVGCQKSETTSSNGTPTDKKAATPASTPAAMTSNSPGATSMTGDKIGVPECDEFLAKYETCINSKVPEAMRVTFNATLAARRTAWHNAASTPQGKAALAANCKSALEQTRTAMASYNCAF